MHTERNKQLNNNYMSTHNDPNPQTYIIYEHAHTPTPCTPHHTNTVPVYVWSALQ